MADDLEMLGRSERQDMNVGAEVNRLDDGCAGAYKRTVAIATCTNCRRDWRY